MAWNNFLCILILFVLASSKIVRKLNVNFVRKILNLLDDMFGGVKQDYFIVKLQSILLIQHQNVNQSYYCCYCGREFTTVRGLNTHRRSCNILDIPNIKELLTTTVDFNENFIESIPEITTNELPESILKADIFN